MTSESLRITFPIEWNVEVIAHEGKNLHVFQKTIMAPFVPPVGFYIECPETHDWFTVKWVVVSWAEGVARLSVEVEHESIGSGLPIEYFQDTKSWNKLCQD